MNEATSAVELTENDIPGAILHEPLGNVTVHTVAKEPTPQGMHSNIFQRFV